MLREQTTQSTRGFCTAGFFPYFFSKSLKASIARALRVVSCSAASIRRALHPSAFILVMIPLNASGSRAFFPVFACAKMHGLDVAHDDTHFDELAKLDA